MAATQAAGGAPSASTRCRRRRPAQSCPCRRRAGTEGGQAPPGVQAAATAPVTCRSGPPRTSARRKLRASGRSVGDIVARRRRRWSRPRGAALQLTPYGAFGYLSIGDMVHARRLRGGRRRSAMAPTEKALGGRHVRRGEGRGRRGRRGPRAHAPRASRSPPTPRSSTSRRPRASGADPSRAPRGEAAPRRAAAAGAGEVPRRRVGRAAAADGELDKARKALDAASQRRPGRPHPDRRRAAARRRRARGAATARRRSPRSSARSSSSNDARAHFGLARAYDLARRRDQREEGDRRDARGVAAAPRRAHAARAHEERAGRRGAGARGPRAGARRARRARRRRRSSCRTRTRPGRGSTSSAARASEARDAFAQAVKLDPRNVEALNGEGRLLLNEGRYTEALARFDTALQVDPASPETIANDAEAKLALERLADAEAAAARRRGSASRRASRSCSCSARSSSTWATTTRPRRRCARRWRSSTRRGATPSSRTWRCRELLVGARAPDRREGDARRRAEEAAALGGARPRVRRGGRAAGRLRRRRSPTTASALAKDPQDVATHFRLAVALRRVRKFDDAGAELDRVAAVDKDYPGLSLERGLLFEESGDVEKAIEQFKGALAQGAGRSRPAAARRQRLRRHRAAGRRAADAAQGAREAADERRGAPLHRPRADAQGRGEQVDALRYLKRAVDLDPNRAEFHVYLAWAANDAQPAQLELARDEIDKALALDKLNAEAYWQRGVLERMRGGDRRRDQGRAPARSQLRPSRYEAHATLAECYEDKNDDAGGARRVDEGHRRRRDGRERRRHGAASVLALQVRQAADRARQRAARRSRSCSRRRSAAEKIGPAPRLARAARVPDGRGAAQDRAQEGRRRALPALPRDRAGQLARPRRRAAALVAEAAVATATLEDASGKAHGESKDQKAVACQPSDLVNILIFCCSSRGGRAPSSSSRRAPSAMRAKSSTSSVSPRASSEMPALAPRRVAALRRRARGAPTRCAASCGAPRRRARTRRGSARSRAARGGRTRDELDDGARHVGRRVERARAERAARAARRTPRARRR